MMQQENVRFERSGSLAILDIRGYVTKSSGLPMKNAFSRIQPAVERAILFRFDPETYINSEGIKTIIDLLLRAKQNEQKVGITGMSEHFKKLFGMVGITKLSRIFDSTEEAVRELLRNIEQKVADDYS